MDILTYINRMNQIYGNGQKAAPRYNTQQYLQGGRVGYQSGQLVQPGPGRQGYDVIGDYSISDLRKLGIVQPMFAWGSKEPSIITAENLQTHGDQMEPHPMSDEEWEGMLMGLTDPIKLKQIKDSINIYEGRSGYQGGQLVDHGPGRQGYGGKGSSSPTYRANLIANLPEGYKKEYTKLLLNETDKVFSRKGGELMNIQGKKPLDYLAGKYKIKRSKIKDINSAILDSLNQENKLKPADKKPAKIKVIKRKIQVLGKNIER